MPMQFDDFIAEIRSLRTFRGESEEFWQKYLGALVDFSGASAGILLGADGEPGSAEVLRLFPDGEEGSEISGDDLGLIRSVFADICGKKGIFLKISGRRNSVLGNALFGLHLPGAVEGKETVLILCGNIDASAGRPAKVMPVLRVVTDVPFQVFSETQQVEEQERDSSLASTLGHVLDVFLVLQREERFKSTLMAFCNELAARFGCSRVAVGWGRSGYVRVEAISHVEKFERKMNVVRELEYAMEEAYDQDETISLPATEQTGAIAMAHEKFARHNGVAAMVSIPLHDGERCLGVVTCERAQESFSDFELRTLAAICSHSGPRMAELWNRDRWFGARMMHGIRNRGLAFFSFENSLTKLFWLVLIGCLGFVALYQWDYRVEGGGVLKTDSLNVLTAPFMGYVEEVDVLVGDRLDRGDRVLKLDTRDLLLEESSAMAEYNRNLRSMEKARAQNALADMRISQARIDQSRAQLERIRYLLERAEIQAPFTGIVVEGDRKKLLGVPVQKGDVLFKLARLDNLYLEIEIDERDVHEVSSGMEGEIAFLSRPEDRFKVRIERLNPVATLKEGQGSVFIARAELLDAPPAWWRPGMSGLAKLDVGQRPLYWVLSHRTIDFFRLHFWW